VTTAEATHVVQILSAGFPRDAIEVETAAVWIGEIARLGRPDAAVEAARLIIRIADRFPSFKEYRDTYRSTLDRMNVGREVEKPDDSVEPDAETRQWFDRQQRTGWQGVTKDMS